MDLVYYTRGKSCCPLCNKKCNETITEVLQATGERQLGWLETHGKGASLFQCPQS
jgi:hypothetical protein